MDIYRFADRGKMYTAISDHIKNAESASGNLKNPPSFFLAGGSSPKGLYKIIGTDIFYSRINFFMGDERWSPEKQDIRNDKMILSSLYTDSILSTDNFFPILQKSSAEKSAKNYRDLISTKIGNDPPFVFLLGIGPDGHTASLFPGNKPDRNDIVIPVPAPEISPQVPRISCNYNYINSSLHIILITGTKGKENVISEILDGNQKYPAAKVKGIKSTSIYILDER